MISQRIGSIFGIPLFLDPSWFVILTLITVLDGQMWYERYNEWGVLAWGAGLVTALLLFGSVLLHELGHSVVALSQGIRVNSITLFLFGGVASIEEESKTPIEAFQVAIAGPAVSFLLFLGLSTLVQVLPTGNPAMLLFREIAHINLVLGVFNLIPGLPLDGGQILKAIVWQFTDDRFKAVRWAAQSGKILGSMAIALGILAMYTEQSFGAFWIILLGWFGIRNANSYDRVTSFQEVLLTATAQETMARNYRVVEATMTLRQFADQYLLEEQHPLAYFAASDGRYRGLISLDKFREMERSLWATKQVQDIADPLPHIASVTETTRLGTIVNLLQQLNLPFITVLSPAGTVSGVIDRADVVRVIRNLLNLNISETDLHRIREDRAYPPGLPLVMLAKSIQPDLEKIS
ncbi:MAG: site-2 protease family protein [Prochlorotrichaceae cyanobacterium]|jgi:Zn-dependent protease